MKQIDARNITIIIMLAEYVICLVGRIANHAINLFYEFEIGSGRL
jgi:hypothetical protein